VSVAAMILRQRGYDDVVVRAVLFHATGVTGVERQSRMEHALYAIDNLTGLIVAGALVRPSKDIREVKVKSVKKKWKDNAFAAGVRREHIEAGAAALGMDLWEHVGVVLEAMQGIAEEMGLHGSPA
jgi:predicted hydrolase (HD superfamily)